MSRFLLCFIFFGFSIAQSQPTLTEHTLGLDSTTTYAHATLADVAWLTGRWEGTGFGGVIEETWSPPMAGTMIGTFRLLVDGKPEFYELLLLRQDSTSLSYQVKHFSPDFKGWEESDASYGFHLIKVSNDAIYFHGLTLQRLGDTCVHYLAMQRQDGTHQEVSLKYVRRDHPVSPVAKDLVDALPPITPVPLLLLGSYHMNNPGADMFNLQADDVLAPKRQEEIQAVVDNLALWRPTKVAVEAGFGDTAIVARYKAYLHGDYTLGKNEREQIGFRLAKQLGHQTIYPIDVQMGMDDSGVNNIVTQEPAKYAKYLSDVQLIGKRAISQMDTWLKEGTIGKMFYNLNDPDILEMAHSFYFRSFVPVIDGDNYAGADMVDDWYRRNLRIFSNLHQISDRPDDRIFVIYGQGHIPLLQQFAEDSPYFSVDRVQEYLKGL